MVYKILLVSIAGGLLQLDAINVGRFMFSTPVVAGLIIGWLLGDLTTGLIVGALIELIWIDTISIGGDEPFDSSTVVVLVSGLAILLGRCDFPSIVFLLLLIIPIGIVSQRINMLMRRLNVKLIYRADKYAAQGAPLKIELLVLKEILFTFARKFLLFFCVFGLGVYVLPKIFSVLPFQIIEGLKWAGWLLLALGFAIPVSMVNFRQPYQKVRSWTKTL